MKMTRTLITILTIGLLCSCFSRDKKQSNSIVEFKTLDTTISFAGFWVIERYVNDIKKTQSARQSQGSDESCITIPERTLQVTRMVWGFHDGGADLVIVKDGDNYQLWDSELKEKAKDIEIISNDKIKIGNKDFIKISCVDNTVTNSNPTILEEILFKGKYRSDNGATIEFKANGQISGLDNFSYYSAIIDYSGPALDIDQIALGQSKNTTNLFGYKFNKDTLSIYKITCTDYDSTNNMCGVVDYGELTYKLWRTE